MFLENSFSQDQRGGWIEVIAGSMFSGKTEELIRRLKRARIARQEVAIFKPSVDTRYSDSAVVSHDANAVDSIRVSKSDEILLHTNEVYVVGIDEAQFFDAGLPDVCTQLANEGKRVIVAGLDMDFRAKPFGVMPALMAVAEYVTKVHAICMRCGELAHHSHRLSEQDALVLLGEKDQYEPLCRACYNEAIHQH